MHSDRLGRGYVFQTGQRWRGEEQSTHGGAILCDEFSSGHVWRVRQLWNSQGELSGQLLGYKVKKEKGKEADLEVLGI